MWQRTRPITGILEPSQVGHLGQHNLPRVPEHRDLRVPPVPLGHQHDLLLIPAPLHEDDHLVGPAQGKAASRAGLTDSTA
jgi:hypothetical protein